MNTERRILAIEWCPGPLLPSLVEVAARAHEAADHGGDDDHEEENGGGDAGQSSRAAGKKRQDITLLVAEGSPYSGQM